MGIGDTVYPQKILAPKEVRLMMDFWLENTQNNFLLLQLKALSTLKVPKVHQNTSFEIIIPKLPATISKWIPLGGGNPLPIAILSNPLRA